MTTGLSNTRNALATGDAHLAQSVADILTTPIGTRVMRRDYGSLLFELVDQPLNALTRLRLYAATAIALARWEPRLKLKRVQFAQGDEPGSWILDLEHERADRRGDTGYARLTVPLRFGASRPFASAA